MAYSRSRLTIVVALAVALAISLLPGIASAAPPAYINADGNCSTPPSSSKTVSVSTENPFLVMDFDRLRLTNGSIIWQLFNVDTGFVQYSNGSTSTAFSLICTVAPGPFAMYWLNSTQTGFVSGADLTAGATYILNLTDVSTNNSKSIRFRAVP